MTSGKALEVVANTHEMTFRFQPLEEGVYADSEGQRKMPQIAIVDSSDAGLYF
jgi:hypothetical protein